MIGEKTPWEDVHKLAKDSLQLENNIKKGRKVYLTPQEKPPEGVRVQRGPKGGLYYEVEWGVNIPTKPAKKVPKKTISEEKLQTLTSDQKDNLIPKANQDVLHALIDDNDALVTREVAKRIDEKGALYMLRNNLDRDTQLYAARRLGPSHFQELARHKDPMIREELAYTTDADGLLKLMNNDFSGVREIVAERLNIVDLPKMSNDKDKNVRKIVKTRLAKLKNLSSMVTAFKQTGKVKLNSFFKKLIKQIQNDEKPRNVIAEYVDSFFNQLGYGDLHQELRLDWERDSSGNISALLKDSVARQYGGKVRYHEGVDIKDWDKYLSEISTSSERKKMDEYVKVHKDFTRECLDILYPGEDTIPMYRGTQVEEIVKIGDKVKILSNSVSSWSDSYDTAATFAEESKGVVLQIKGNKEDIWATSLSIVAPEGEAAEGEFILIGSKKDLIGSVIK